MRERQLKTLLLLVCMMLPACSWFRAKTPPPVPPQIIVTGAPVQSIVFIDGVQKGEPAATNDRPQVLSVPEGTHTVEVRVGGAVVYRESVFVKNGERRAVTVLSGSYR
jgi:uncharacterized lipoprotein YbaY